MFAAAGENPLTLYFITAAVGDLPAARSYLERGLPNASTVGRAYGTRDLAWIHRESSDTARARELVQEATREFRQYWGGQPKKSEDYADLATIRIVEGDRDSALQTMEEAVRQGWRLLYGEDAVDPILNSLRGEPRYDRLMAEVKADVERMRARVEREGW